MRDPRAFRIAVAALGVVPAATGLATLARGTAVVRGGERRAANVESEHRFLGTWWTALGPALWAIAPRAERRTAEVRFVAGALFAGGLARVAAARQHGRPDRLYQVLGAIELALPVALVAWQHAVGAGDENRTRVTSLEDWSSTIELRPR